jgi:prolyl oligopeptidase
VVEPLPRRNADKINYPASKRVEQIDDYFGTMVADPYRWLEDDRSEETARWIQAQNAVTFAYLDKIPFREALRRRITEIYRHARISAPTRAGEYYLFSKNEGLQNQSVLYVQRGLDGPPQVLMDPNSLAPDGTVRINFAGISGSKKYVAVSRSEAGSDWSEIRIIEIATQRELPDRIQWTKFASAAWMGEGFFYSGYDRPSPGHELTATNEYQKVFYHKLGEPQEKDGIIFEDKQHPRRYLQLRTTEDERYAFLTISEGTSGNELYWKDLHNADALFRPLIRGFGYDNECVEEHGGNFIVLTNYHAPNFRLVIVDPNEPANEKWQTLVEEKPEVLVWASAAGAMLFCGYLKDASTRIYRYELDGNLVGEISLPALGTAERIQGWRDDTVIFYTFTSFTVPTTIYKYEIASGGNTVFHKAEVAFSPEDYLVKQVFYHSKDGTKVPMFIVHKKGLVLDGRNPCYLTGYGGFNISVQPSFSPSLIAVLEKGCVFAEANLRGGNEYGEIWHKAGMMQNKQNVFDDFIAAAEYLISNCYTSNDTLAIAGGSNGGLLVGAAMTQRPDLFRVALPAVGVLDMLRFQKFTVGWGWVVEYGSSDKEDEFRNLLSYSPLHNLRDGISYPATLVTTADHDDRVVPAHSFKFIAALQAKQKGEPPVLIRIETRSGHGVSSVAKTIAQMADIYAFFLQNVEAEWSGS